MNLKICKKNSNIKQKKLVVYNPCIIVQIYKMVISWDLAKSFNAYIQCILAHDAKMLSHDEANLAQSVKKNIKKIYITAGDPNMLFSLG